MVRQYWLPLAVCALVLTVHSVLAVNSALAQSPPAAGEAEVVEYSTGDQTVSIQFRYCPAGNIIPGPPDSESQEPVEVGGFFVSETEITVGQFRAVLGMDGLAGPVSIAEKLTASPQLLQSLQEGDQEPVFLMGLADCYRFCQELERLSEEARKQRSADSIEAIAFRLPTAVEWQYAGRGIAEASRQNELPHFNRWVRPNELSVTTQQKCQEVWETLGLSTAFTGSQEDFLRLSAASGASEQQKVKDILVECFAKSLEAEERSAAGIGRISPVGQNEPNSWGIHDIHGSVAEWTLWVDSQDNVETEWERLADQTDADLAEFDRAFLAGGSFADSYLGQDALRRFTLWSGKRFIPGATQYSRQAVEDATPGFRIVMKRRLADDWLYFVRNGVFDGVILREDADEFMQGAVTNVNRLTAADASERMVAKVYLALARSADHPAELQTAITEFAETAAADTAGSDVDDVANELAALLGNSKSDDSDSSGSESDDSVYFELFAGSDPS